MDYFEYSDKQSYAVGRPTLPAESFDGEFVPIESRIRLGYGKTAADYLKSGDRDVGTMLRILQQTDTPIVPGARCLDFGCGGGRMLRHLPVHLPGGEYWGCDTESRAVAWAQCYLDDRFRFFTNIREPHLPFVDGHFDFIYAGSVFSHLHDMAEFWLLELRRITRAQTGVLYLTFQDDHSLDFIRRQGTEAARHYHHNLFVEGQAQPLFDGDYQRVVVGRSVYSAQVFYRTPWLKQLLGKFFRHVELVPNGYGWQTAAILKT